jgi:UDP-glucose 4-epimerase
MTYKVLVTGGAGFIGSHVVERLVKLGYSVIVLDNLSSGSLSNLSTVVKEIKFINGDVRRDEDVNAAVDGVDAVIHLASLVSVAESFERPLLYHDVNASGTLKLLDICARYGVKRFIYASSCAVYGDTLMLPINEERAINPLSPYAASKVAGEAYCKAFSSKVSICILRLFNVYGPRQRDGEYAGVISRFISRVRNNLPPIIYGDGLQSRDFIHVYDVAEFFVRAVNTYDASGIFNIGFGKRISVNELAEMIIKQADKIHIKPMYTDARAGEVRHSEADASRAFKVFNYKPRITLDEGIRELLYLT